MRAKFNIGDKVRAARKFRESYFQFSGVKMITETERYNGALSYTLEGKGLVGYFAHDLQFVCGHKLNDECNSCQHRFRCYTTR